MNKLRLIDADIPIRNLRGIHPDSALMYADTAATIVAETPVIDIEDLPVVCELRKKNEKLKSDIECLLDLSRGKTLHINELEEKIVELDEELNKLKSDYNLYTEQQRKIAFDIAIKYGFCGDCRWVIGGKNCVNCDCYQNAVRIIQDILIGRKKRR